jgi:hypothetical protein
MGRLVPLTGIAVLDGAAVHGPSGAVGAGARVQLAVVVGPPQVRSILIDDLEVVDGCCREVREPLAREHLSRIVLMPGLAVV